MTIFLLAMLAFQSLPVPEGTRFDVEHEHLWGACHGQLIFEDASIRYESDNAEHSGVWSYPDVASFEILSTERIRLHTYESNGPVKLWRDRSFTFRLENGPSEFGPDLFAFLEARSPRPVRTRVSLESEDSGTVDETTGAGVIVQELGVRHDHFLGGCQGTLQITGDSIFYRTDHADHSRIWRISDVESFASTDEFDLRISTRDDTFHFDLKTKLDPLTYAHLWDGVYEPRLQSYRGGTR